jgi:hypothetical protein
MLNVSAYPILNLGKGSLGFILSSSSILVSISPSLDSKIS